MKTFLIPLILFTCVMACACGKSNQQSAASEQQPVTEIAKAKGAFNADSAYHFIEKQLAFGPRVPGTVAHDACGDWLETKLRQYKADTIINQKVVLPAYNGTQLPINNIIASYNTESPSRVLLVAHWDTRPWADADPDQANHTRPVPGANDGGSGVGVLLEIARNLAAQRPGVGVDIFFTDAEDYGHSDNFSSNDDSWCLGTQYFVANLPFPVQKKPRFAIVLDMVGGKGATFKRENLSMQYARPFVEMIWNRAAQLGFGDRFLDEDGVGIIDDHLYLNRGGIPAVDIVECEHPLTNSFPPEWHTVNDNINVIDTATINAVGTTVLDVIYNL